MVVCSMTVISSACSVFGVRNSEMPAYEVLLSEDNKEIRAYAPYLVARTIVEGEYEDTANPGFRILFDYISGKNLSSEQVEMTAPVQQERTGEKIEMTSPVLQERAGEKVAMTAPVQQEKTGQGWSMAFILPKKYTIETAPKPLDPRIEIIPVPAKTMAALRYSGFTDEEKITRKGEELIRWQRDQGYLAVGEPFSARYDPPWTLPFLRRNEVMVEVEKREE
jgi:hypothetical protein